ncbi:MAG TPA: D-glycero-beta-D-manno-heptose 1-phosphate adenylyltransferase [Phycisphaerae bacterium]|nr:D-glycero-beta-D-manno-heptose 1-phosphate adenylyltransferase [Phycisphaerae bacterium]
MWQRLLELLQGPCDRHILVVGDFMIDRYLYGDAERISPEAPVPVLRVVQQEDALGGAGSVVADIAALGATAHCVGILGKDTDADVLAGLLSKLQVDGSGLIRCAGRRTTRKTRLIGLAQHRHRQQLIRIDDESPEPFEDGDALMAQVNRLLPACHAVCMEDYNKGVVTEKLAAAVIEAANKQKVPVLVDPASISDYRRYRGATVITPNRTETEKALGGGRRLQSINVVKAAAKEILAACHTQNVCVTLDAEGAALIGPGGSFEHIPTVQRDVYDVTGAGDEVLAAMAVAVASGASLPEAAALANVAGGLEVEKFGCVPITRDEVLGEILLQHHKDLGKIRTVEQLLPELARRRSRHEKVAFTNGCFDLLHAGHVANFAFCKQHADVLVVGLNTDESVRRLEKGANRPIVDQAGRAAVLAALENVDYVVLFDEDTPLKLIEAIRPEVLLKGADWKDKKVVGQDVVEKNGGKVLLVPLVEGRSTSGIIERIRKG